MRAFRSVEGGHASAVEDWERELLARLALEVEALLGAEGRDSRSVQGQCGDAAADEATARVGERPGESSRDRELLAALEPGSDRDAWAAPATGALSGTVELLEVLLPEASEDPGTAVELRELTREQLRQDKASRLVRLAEELRAPSAQGEVLVPCGQEGDWLGAVNDIRLVLAHRLGIESAQDAEDVHAVASEEPPEDETFHQRWRRGTALVYDMVTWWQESLVSALLWEQGPHSLAT